MKASRSPEPLSRIANPNFSPLDSTFSSPPLSFPLECWNLLFSISFFFSARIDSLSSEIVAAKDATITELRLESDRVISAYKAEILSLNAELASQSKQLDFLYAEEQSRKELQASLEARRAQHRNRARQSLRDGATYPELEESLRVISNKKYKSSFAQSRDIVALLLLFFTGLRVSNLRLLTSNNLSSFLDASRKSIDIRLIKTGSRVEPLRLYLDASCHKLALEYESHFLVLQRNKQGDDFVFTGENRKDALERAWLTNRLNSILKVTSKSFKKKLSTHSFRIGQVNNLIQVFGIEGAKRLIGHKSIATTSRYSRGFSSTREMERGMQKVEKLKNRSKSVSFNSLD